MITVFELVMKRALRQRLIMAMVIVFPILLVLIPQPTNIETPTLSYGFFGLVMMFVTFLLAKQVIEDREMRTIVRIASAPISHRDYLLAHLGAYTLIMIFQVTVFWVLSFIVWDAPWSFFLSGYSLMLIFAITATGFALFWHSLFKRYTTSISVFSVVANLMAVLGGMSLPLALLPDHLRRVAVVLPTYWYAYGLEQATEKTFGMVILSLCILIGFATIFITVGSKRRLA